MGSKLRVAGHPLHPLLVHFPVALWTIAVFAELGAFATGRDWWAVSFGCQALGVLFATAAMVPGFFDFVTLPRSHRAFDTAVFHMLAMSGAWLLFIASLALWGQPATAAPPIVATAAAVAGFACMATGGWLGGRLVYRFGVGVSSTQSS